MRPEPATMMSAPDPTPSARGRDAVGVEGRDVSGVDGRRAALPRRLSLPALIAWRALAVVCVVLGAIGVVLPGLPTVPFLLVAAWAAGKGWPRLEAWLLAHPTHGPAIRRWRDHGAVPRRAKWAASLMMAASAGVLALSAVPLWAKWIIPAGMAAVAIWLWRRPEA